MRHCKQANPGVMLLINELSKRQKY